MKNLARFLSDFVRDIGTVDTELEISGDYLYFEARKLGAVVVRFYAYDGSFTLEVNYPGIGMVKIHSYGGTSPEFLGVVRDFILSLLKVSGAEQSDIQQFRQFMLTFSVSSESEPFFLGGHSFLPTRYNSPQGVVVTWGRP